MQSYTGKTCPYCQYPIKQDSDVVICRECNIPHHAECLRKNGGCTTFGCKESVSEQDKFNSIATQTDERIMIDLNDDHSTTPPWAKSTPSCIGCNAHLSYDSFMPNGPQIRPWVRFFARLTDVYLFSLIFGIILAFVYPLSLEMNDLLLGAMILAIFIFIEPLFLSTWGSTPGKALLNVRLRKSDGGKPNYEEAFIRSFNVWLRGEGLGIPIVNLVTRIFAYTKLTGEGITTWDKSGGFSVSHRTISAWRIVLIIAIHIGFFVVQVIE